MSVLALTGATGFVGRATLERALSEGLRVRALTRRPQPARDRVEWIAGSLESSAALAELVRGADAVLHVAGVVNASDPCGFERGNVEGTKAMIAAARAAGVLRFVHVSSLAAREPLLSDYCRTKAGAEEAVRASGLAWTTIRPPAVYGPGDLEMLDIFRAARRGIVPLPPRGRASLIHVEDLARLLLAALTKEAIGRIYEADDGVPGGWTHAETASAIGAAVGRKVLALPIPRPVLAAAARFDRIARGARAKLTPDRARYLSHPDWTVDPANRPPDSLWTAQIDTRGGLAGTAAWYRAQGLL